MRLPKIVLPNKNPPRNEIALRRGLPPNFPLVAFAPRADSGSGLAVRYPPGTTTIFPDFFPDFFPRFFSRCFRHSLYKPSYFQCLSLFLKCFICSRSGTSLLEKIGILRVVAGQNSSKLIGSKNFYTSPRTVLWAQKQSSSFLPKALSAFKVCRHLYTS